MKSLSDQKQKLFIATTLFLLCLGVAGGFQPRFTTSMPEAPSLNLSTHQLASLAYIQAQNKKLAQSKEATLFLLQKGYKEPKFSHWGLGHLGLISGQEKDYKTVLEVYGDLVRLRGLEQDQSHYVWALSQKGAEKSPESLEKALELLTESQEKVKELGEQLQLISQGAEQSSENYPKLQLSAWEAAQKVEQLLAALSQPQAN